jgi:hypothetical protein
MSGYTVCKYCLRPVQVVGGKLVYHTPGNDKPTCKGFKTDALWTEDTRLTTIGRNPQGYCRPEGGSHRRPPETEGCQGPNQST